MKPHFAFRYLSKIIGFAALLFLPFVGFGQTGIITGKVSDLQTNSPVEYATIALIRLNDSLLISGTLSAQDGSFSITNVNPSTYFLRIQFMGYETYYSVNINVSNQTPANLQQIYLKKSAFALDEVQVVSDKAFVEYKIDKKVINISRQLSAAGGTATDAIKNIPSVETTLSGEVKLRGSTNFTLLIDGKPTLIDASDMLDQISASTIDKIEIITNPSAKYDPDGTSGIINVVMKKDAIDGISGIVNLSGGTGIQYSGDASVNYRNEKIDVSAGIEISDHNILNTELSDRETILHDTTIYLSIHDEGNRFNGKKSFKGSMNYYLSKRNTLSLSANYSLLSIGHKTTSKNHQWTNTDATGNYFISEDKFEIAPKLLELSLGDEHMFDSTGQHKLSFNFFTVNVDVHNEELLDKYISTGDFTESTALYDKTKRITTEKVNLYDIDLDYRKPLGKNATLEAGYQMKRFNSSNNYDVFSFNNTLNSLEYDSAQSNAVTFSRQIHAAYSTLTYGFGEWELKAGLRMEYTDQLLTQRTMNTSYSYKKLDFYPSAFLSRQLPYDQQIQISYSRRTDRPQTQFLNPYTFFSDGFTAVKGNPDLTPDFTNAFELNYQKRFGGAYISVEPYFRQTKNKITRVQEVDDEGIVVRTMKNLDSDYALGVEIAAAYKPFPWVEMTPRATWFKYHLEGSYNADDVVKNSENWRIGLTSTITFNPNTSLQLNSNYDSPTATLDGQMKGFFYSGFALRQYLFKRKASLSLRVEDIFDTRHMKISSYTSDFNQNSEMYVTSPQIIIGFTYKFNNYQKNKQKEKEMINQYNIY